MSTSYFGFSELGDIGVFFVKVLFDFEVLDRAVVHGRQGLDLGLSLVFSPLLFVARPFAVLFAVFRGRRYLRLAKFVALACHHRDIPIIGQ